MARLFPVGVFSARYDVEDLDSPEIRASFMRHMNGMDILINLLEEPTVLMKQIEHLAKQHAIDGMKSKYFTVSFIDLYATLKYGNKAELRPTFTNGTLPTFGRRFSARPNKCYSALYAIAHREIVTPVDQSKTVEVRITQLLPQSSPMTLVS